MERWKRVDWLFCEVIEILHFYIFISKYCETADKSEQSKL